MILLFSAASPMTPRSIARTVVNSFFTHNVQWVSGFTDIQCSADMNHRRPGFSRFAISRNCARFRSVVDVGVLGSSVLVVEKDFSCFTELNCSCNPLNPQPTLNPKPARVAQHSSRYKPKQVAR